MNEDQVKELTERRLELVRLYQSVFLTPSGVKVFQDLIRRCGVLDTVASNDKEYSSLLEGRRRVGLILLNLVFPDLLNELPRLCESKISLSTLMQVVHPEEVPVPGVAGFPGMDSIPAMEYDRRQIANCRER